ncbi:response regulator receiver protein [Halarcobacter mediterraneus]|uniref:Response regulator receiver protein n=1 Tax=Halarcobacter mediterraneus TaxID=2023153 RepID=A0A4V1M170_9BACT|nr:HD domain-containing phosphohydrolase [Halarcobacter mediterraneus]RXK12485.1 response regulator receiver protein [Halarcobacter mediterraneus]
MRKTLLILLCALFIFILIHKFYYEVEIKKLTEEIYTKKSKEVKQLFRNEVKKKFGRTFGLTYLLSKDKQIIDALLKNDNSSLDYRDLIDEIEEYGEYKNLWVQIIDKNGYSFYRSWTNKVGDHAASARIDIADMIKSPKPIKGISTGRFDMTFKTMIPLFHKGKFLGIIEMISKFNSIAKILKEQNIEPLMVLHENYTKRFIKPFTGLFIENNYVANLNASKSFMEKAEKIGIKKLMYLEKPLVLKEYIVITDQIKNMHGGEMGFFIFFLDKEKLDKSILYNFKVEYFIKVSILLIILILLFLYILNRNYTKQLNKDVEKKTSKIKKQKEKLKSLLKIYDKNVIFSKTDSKGIITHASKAFCEISGYTLEELIGKPHNIVRHPDMPKIVFKQMWETIKSGKIWRGEVKNLRKDGSFYWVEAEVEPIYKNKEIVGFSAVRQDITDAKEIEEIQKEIIFTMGSIGERRSEETGNHVKRVAEYSKLLALKYGLNEQESEMLKQASPMHDIGKVAIPDSILNKPDILTEEERKIMQTHAQLGYEMLKNSNRPLLKTAATIAYEHHERWDGTGYPRGLKGSDINIYGRITAIADVFDALGSSRCYKEAWEDERIFKFLKEESSKYFDPKLIKIFFENLDEFLEIRDSFSD